MKGIYAINKGLPAYNTSHIKKEESNKIISDARIFNERQIKEKRDREEEELIKKMIEEDELKNAENERLMAVYPQLVYGKEANKLWNDKFGYKPTPRPKPKTRKTTKPTRSNPKPTRSNPKPKTRNPKNGKKL